MPNISPIVKKALSAVLVAVASALLIAIQQQLVPLAPAGTQPTIVALLAGLAHYLDAWGHSDRVAAAADKVAASKRAPSVPPFAAMLCLVLAFALTACATTKPPCDQTALAVIVATCTAKSQDCVNKGITQDKCTALADCDAQIEKACGQ